MKAVILSGSPGTSWFPLANEIPKLLLPIANERSLQFTLRSLRRSGVINVAIIGSTVQHCDPDTIEKVSRTEPGLKISYFEEAQPCGTAGALKGLRGFLGTSSFLVLGANVFCDGLDLKSIIAFHQSKRAFATIGVELIPNDLSTLENIEVAKDGRVLESHLLHHSHDRRRPLRPCGIYVFQAEVLDYIPLLGHMDIKEQLIPRLRSEGERVLAHRTPEPLKKIDTITDYFQLNRELLIAIARRSMERGSATRLMDSVWVGKGVEMGPRVDVVGPVLIGDHCQIGNRVRIIGPTVIGDHSQIEELSYIRECILLSRSRLMRNAYVEYSVISQTSAVSMDQCISNSIVMNGESFPGRLPLTVRDGLRDDVPTHYQSGFSESWPRRLQHYTYLTTKRTLDVMASVVGLTALLPIFMLITLYIKSESPGPIIFGQRRCGKDGREFTMFKFRTMIDGADENQSELAAHKDIDGPMFKMNDDPRITSAGRFLRKIGLDELPQLLNVLRGEMSLVGPRPLAIEEMRFAPSWRDIRLRVTPGITGLWQIAERDEVAVHRWIRSDIDYVRRQSLWLDAVVLFKTVLFAFKGLGT